MLRSALRASLLLGALAAGALVAVAPSCTVFDGLTAHLDAGADADGGDPEPPPSLLSLADAAHVCALVAACPALGPSLVASTGLPLVHVTSVAAGALPAFDFRFSACLDWLASPFPPAHPGLAYASEVVACVAATQSCAGAAACVGLEVLEPADPRCSGLAQGHCTPDRSEAIDCVALLSSHCGSDLFTPGSECFPVGPGADTRVRCGLGYCAAYQGVSCAEGLATLCTADKVRVGYACDAFGLSCVEGVTGTVGCVGEGGAQACSDVGAEACAGASIVRVCGVGLYAEVDCASADRACVEEGPTARCAPAFTTCSPYDGDVDVCDGTSIRTCVNGQRVLLDCADVGAACVPASGSLSARCG